MTYGFKHKSRRRRLSWKGSGLGAIALCPLITRKDPDDLPQTVFKTWCLRSCQVSTSKFVLELSPPLYHKRILPLARASRYQSTNRGSRLRQLPGSRLAAKPIVPHLVYPSELTGNSYLDSRGILPAGFRRLPLPSV